MAETRPQTPSELIGKKFLRYVHPTDPTKIIELALVNTGETTTDGHEIWAQRTDSSEFGAKTEVIFYAASIPPGATVEGASKELANNKGIAITVNVVLHASATAGIEVWLLSSTNGTDWDTVKYVEDLEPPFTGAGQTEQNTTPVDSVPKYVRAVVKNLDANYSHAVSVKCVSVE